MKDTGNIPESELRAQRILLAASEAVKAARLGLEVQALIVTGRRDVIVVRENAACDRLESAPIRRVSKDGRRRLFYAAPFGHCQVEWEVNH